MANALVEKLISLMTQNNPLAEKLRSLDGSVIRINEYVGRCDRPVFNNLNWAIVDIPNRKLSHYFSLHSDMIFGFIMAHYYPARNIPEISGQRIGSNEDLCFVNGNPFGIRTNLGIYGFERLKCTPGEYDDGLLKIFKELNLDSNLDLEQISKEPINVKRENGVMTIYLRGCIPSFLSVSANK